MREKGEWEDFKIGEREAWRGKSVKVALRGRGEREALIGRGDYDRHGQGAEGDWRDRERGWVRASSNSVKKGAGRGKCKI